MTVLLRPKVRNGFSDRNGINKINTILQKDDLDERTRNQIINVIDMTIKIVEDRGLAEEFYEYIYKHIYSVTEDSIPYYDSDKRKSFALGIQSDWKIDEVFSFLEAISYWYEKNINFKNIRELFNNLFEKECVAYRFVNNQITNIIEENEIKEIEEAMNCSYSACKASINKAFKLLFDRTKPDYSNSIKESISAIEGMCNIIVGTKNSTLGDALKKLENYVPIHPCMKSAFDKLYGYTSDKNGIRHNGGVDQNTTFEEAKYMLVSCSGFLNYLIDLYEKKSNKK